MKTPVLIAGGAVFAAAFVWKTFLPAWNVLHTDFPNYYVAARATLDGVPLSELYEWATFNRLIRDYGIDGQLGAYAPQPPPAMFLFLPLARLEPRTAKRVWLVVNLLLLLATAWMLRASCGLGRGQILALGIAGYGALHTNFLYGQYYAMLLFLLTLAWLLLERRPGAAGAVTGIIAALKLWGAPFVLYFARMGGWRALGGLVAAGSTAVVISVVAFGMSGNWFFTTVVLPRAVDGLLIDPYHPVFDSFTVLLRRAFVREPSLNPAPWLEAPAAFFFLRRLLGFGILGLTLLAVPRHDSRVAFAWFTIALLLVSPVTGSYHVLILVLPVALLLIGASRRFQVLLVGLLFAAAMPFAGFPFHRTFALAALWIVTGIPLIRGVQRRELALAAAALIVAAGAGAWRQMAEYRREPAQMYEPVPLPPGTLFASSPTVTTAGLTYDDIRSVRPAGTEAASPDGRFLAHTRRNQLVLTDLKSNSVRVLTPDHCNSHSPAWSPDSQTLYFASDCGRGYGLPALYRAGVP
jgi:hypothetical protein